MYQKLNDFHYIIKLKQKGLFNLGLYVGGIKAIEFSTVAKSTDPQACLAISATEVKRALASRFDRSVPVAAMVL